MQYVGFEETTTTTKKTYFDRPINTQTTCSLPLGLLEMLKFNEWNTAQPV